MAPKISWSGVFPAVTTQFKPNFELDIEATRRVLDGLVRDGVSGLIVCGTVGENTSLSRAPRRLPSWRRRRTLPARPRAGHFRHRRIHHAIRLRSGKGRRAASGSTA